MKTFLLILLGIGIGYGLALLIGSIRLNKALLSQNYSTQP